MKCDLCRDDIELYYEQDGKILCMSCYDNPDRDKKKITIDKKIDNICNKCHNKISYGKQKFQFINEEGDEITLCSKCYDIETKEKKLKLIPTSKKPMSFNSGWMFGIAGGMGAKDQQRATVDNTWKKYNLTLEEINEYAIINFNKHFLICDNNTKAIIMSKMGSELKQKKLNEIAKTIHNKDFKGCERKERKLVKKELKMVLNENLAKNKDKGSIF